MEKRRLSVCDWEISSSGKGKLLRNVFAPFLFTAKKSSRKPTLISFFCKGPAKPWTKMRQPSSFFPDSNWVNLDMLNTFWRPQEITRPALILMKKMCYLEAEKENALPPSPFWSSLSFSLVGLQFSHSLVLLAARPQVMCDLRKKMPDGRPSFVYTVHQTDLSIHWHGSLWKWETSESLKFVPIHARTLKQYDLRYGFIVWLSLASWSSV